MTPRLRNSTILTLSFGVMFFLTTYFSSPRAWWGVLLFAIPAALTFGAVYYFVLYPRDQKRRVRSR